MANITETKREYLIKAELPDVDRDVIHVTVKDGALTIDGERKHRKKEEGETCHRIESVYGKFSRTLAISANVDEPKIRA